LTVTAFVAPEYVRPVEKVVVAELNLEKSAAARQPKTEAEAVSQLRAPVVMVRPVPARLFTDSAFTMRLVVLAVEKEEYVDEAKVFESRGRVEILVVEVARRFPTVS